MAGEWYEAAPLVLDGPPKRPALPPRPVNRSGPAAQALAGSTTDQPRGASPVAPQASAAAGQSAPVSADAWWEAAPLVADADGQSAEPPARDVGWVETAGRTAGAAATPVVRTAGLGLAGALELMGPVASLVDAVAPIFGVKSNAAAGLRAAQERVFAQTDETVESMRDFYDPKPGEEMSLPGQIVGGVASLPVEVVGGFGAQRGVERAADVVQRGGSLGEASVAGGVTGAANVAANLLPVKVGGAAGRAVERRLGGGTPGRILAGAATGGALAAGADTFVTAAENSALPEGEQFEDLQREVDPATAGGVGAAFGAAASVLPGPAPRALRASRSKAAQDARPGSAGAALADDERIARERAAQFGVELTKGQADRADTDTRQFEVETAKTAGGARLRQFRVAQNRRLEEKLDEWIEQTGAERSDRAGAGEAVTTALEKRLQAEKAAYRAKYEEADALGELEAPIDAAPVVRVLDRMQAEGRDANAGNIRTFVQTLKSMGGLVEGEDGSLQPGQLTIKQAEEFRKSLRANTKTEDNTQQAAAEDVRKALDGVLDESGGSVYREARGLYRQTAERFKDRQLIRELVSMRKATPADRQVAVENVVDRVIGKGRSADQLVHLRDTLAGDDGAQAWREVQGEALRRIRDRGFGNASRDIDRKASVSAPKLGKAIDELDSSGKLEILFGKSGAEKLRDFALVASDIGTEVKGVDNASNTASALRTWARDAAINAATGGNPILSKIATLMLEAFGGRQERIRVRRSLEQPRDLLVSRSADPDARPFEPILRRADSPSGEKQSASPAVLADTAAGARTDPRLAEIERMRAAASPEVARVLDERATAVQAELRRAEAVKRRDAEARKLDEAAKQATDPALRAALVERANRLRSEPIPVGEAQELLPPTGRAPDLPRLPLGSVTELAATAPGRAALDPVVQARKRKAVLVSIRGCLDGGSVTTCLRRAGQFVDAEDKAAILDAARIYRADGVPVDAAARRAVDERLLSVERELETAMRTPARVPLPEVRELSIDEVEALTPSPREIELARLRDAAFDPEVRKDLDRQVSAERKRAADLMRGEEYLRLADQASEAPLRADLEAKAAKLGATRVVPTGEAIEIDEAAWAAANKLPPIEIPRARSLAGALRKNSDAAEAAAVQLRRSPRAFDREIQRINEQGANDATQPPGPDEGSEGLQPPSGRSQEGGRAEAGYGRQGAAAGEAPADPEAEEVAAAARLLASRRKPKPETESPANAADALDLSQLRRANDVALRLAQQVEAAGANDLVRRLRVEADRVRKGADGMPKTLAAIQRAAADMLEARAAALARTGRSDQL